MPSIESNRYHHFYADMLSKVCVSRVGVCSSYILKVVAVIEETTYNILFGVITLSSLCNVIQGVCVCVARRRL